MDHQPSLHQSGKMYVGLIIGLLALSGVAGGVMAGIWVFNNVDARLILQDQPARVQLPDTVSVKARINNNLDISLDEMIRTQVPIKKDVLVPVDEQLNLTAAIKTGVPVSLNVRVKDIIPIDQVLDLNAVVEAEVLGEIIDIPIRGKVPVRADVPIDLSIPVKEVIDVDLVTPVKAKLVQELTVPLNTVIDATIPIRSNMSVPVSSVVDADVFFEQHPIDITIQYSDLRIGLDTLKLQLSDDEIPQREAGAK